MIMSPNDASETVPVTVEVPVDAVAPEELPVDPNALIAADVELARQEEETKRAQIAARTEVRLAEIQAEAPPWLNDLQTSLTTLAERVTAMETRLSSTPPISNVTVVTEPTAPVVVAEPAALESGEVTPEPGEAVIEPAAEVVEEVPPAPRKPRWI